MSEPGAGPRVDPARFAVTSDCSEAEFLAAVRVYAREVVVAHDLSVGVSDLSWAVSTRAKRRAGAVKHNDGDPSAVVLTWAHFEAQGWDAAAATVRHELAHVHLLKEYGDPGHGERFRRLAERLDAPVHCERFTSPEWWVVCTSCGERLARYRESKLVKEPAQYQCGACGGSFRVERNDCGGAVSQGP